MEQRTGAPGQQLQHESGEAQFVREGAYGRKQRSGQRERIPERIRQEGLGAVGQTEHRSRAEGARPEGLKADLPAHRGVGAQQHLEAAVQPETVGGQVGADAPADGVGRL